ncbi:C4-dicarboxylate transporter DctA [Streptomyces cinereospinus]
MTALTAREIVTAFPGSAGRAPDRSPGREPHAGDTDDVKEGSRDQRSRHGTCRTPAKRDRTHYLYIAVIVAVALGIAVGLAAPDFAVELKPVGTGFVNLIKMMISPIIFCTIVLGIGSVRKAAKVGAVGGIALVYFLVMSLVALAIGLVVGNVLDPGTGLAVTDAVRETGQAQVDAEAKSTTDFLLGVIPATIVSAFTEGEVLQTLLVALLAGFALQAMGPAGQPVLRGIEHIQRLVFRILAMIMWAAPVGAFGAIAAVTGSAGLDALKSLAVLMLGFYVTCLLFVLVVLGTLLRIVSGLNLLTLFRYLGREFLLILSTSSSESALPRLIAKMEHLGVSKPVVGITVPTGYSFNLDGTMIYMTMASLFIADAMGTPMGVGEQIPLLLFLLVASKGAAGVTGAGLATLAGGLQSHKPALVDGIGLIVGIDRFMSEARALTNFAGNAVATVLIGTWTKEIDKERVGEVLAGRAAVRREDPARRRPRRRRRTGRRHRGARPARRRRAGRREGTGQGLIRRKPPPHARAAETTPPRSAARVPPGTTPPRPGG